MTTDKIVMWGTRLSIVDWVYFKTQILLETLSLNQPRGESYVSSDVEHFASTSWTCKKQTSVSHSSTESEVISLDDGLRIDGILGIPALDLWDVVIKVLHSSKNTHQAVRNHCRKEKVDQVPKKPRSEIQNTNTKSKRHGNREVFELSNVDHVATNASFCQFEAQLYIFWKTMRQ